MMLTSEQIDFLNEACKTLYKITQFNDVYSEWTYSNGKVDVEGNVNMSGFGLTEIPVKFGEVSGCFDCSYNNLTTLKNCPDNIGEDFSIEGNNLTEYFKNLKEEYLEIWGSKLDWDDVLREYPFLINIFKRNSYRLAVEKYLNKHPMTKLYYRD